MAIVRLYSKPSLFITFTCNPQWPEIKSSLFANELPSDRPDICVRVFNIKLRQLLTDLTKHHCLGKVVAYTATKEDQKRGLNGFLFSTNFILSYTVNHILIYLQSCKCGGTRVDGRPPASFGGWTPSPHFSGQGRVDAVAVRPPSTQGGYLGLYM
jgi:hypothetical protein